MCSDARSIASKAASVLLCLSTDVGRFAPGYGVALEAKVTFATQPGLLAGRSELHATIAVVELPASGTYVPCIPVPSSTIRLRSLLKSPILTFSSPTTVVIVLLHVAPNGSWTKATGWRESLKEVRKKGERVSEEAREEEA